MIIQETSHIVCPKCGSTYGWAGPTYYYQERHRFPGLEWLSYTCLTCRYQRREPTKDASAQPAPVILIDEGETFLERHPALARVLTWLGVGPRVPPGPPPDPRRVITRRHR